MAAHARIAHHVPGRIRMSIPSAKGKPNLLNQIKQSISATEGVGRVEVHPTTGSIVVHYRRDPTHPGRFRKALTQQGHASGMFDLAPPDLTDAGDTFGKLQQEAQFLASRSELAEKVVETTEQVNVAIRRATDNNLDLKVLVPGVLAFYSALYLGADFSTPLWITLGIFSFNSFVALHPPLPGQTKGHIAK